MTAALTPDAADRADAWLARLGAWCGYGAAHRRTAVATEVVRGIVGVTDPEYVYALSWATYGQTGIVEPSAAEWRHALELYGPVLRADEREARAVRLASAAAERDRVTVNRLVRS